ncbi:MAG: hypothetical protein N3D71_09060, partial [Burkholderiaceae bacterium]|nr:hypothetical protein [Burkholderiaceae bacterium]
ILASACLALAPPAWAQNRSMPDERAIAQEMEKARERAAQIFEQMSTQETFAEFLTLPLYEELE